MRRWTITTVMLMWVHLPHTVCIGLFVSWRGRATTHYGGRSWGWRDCTWRTGFRGNCSPIWPTTTAGTWCSSIRKGIRKRKRERFIWRRGTTSPWWITGPCMTAWSTLLTWWWSWGSGMIRAWPNCTKYWPNWASLYNKPNKTTSTCSRKPKTPSKPKSSPSPLNIT